MDSQVLVAEQRPQEITSILFAMIVSGNRSVFSSISQSCEAIER